MHNDNSNRHVITLGLVLALLLALWLRLPFIGAGMPYFYDEDEAHHFNRTVEMVKKGEFNPNYFHKPSLHFYLRMPVVAVAFLWTVRNGQIRSVQDIQTRDPYGLGGYAFTASHPGIVKWNRALSVAFSLGLVLLAFLITKELLACEGAALLAALGTAVSPELIENAAVIGVDMPMALLCLLAVYLALKLYRSFSVKLLVLTGLVCGLAVSAKYNALPIMFLPLLVLLLLRRFAFTELLLAITVPVLGFLVGSPFTLLSLPLFLDQFAYEIWHYGVSGHEGHSAEPGWPQALFYLKWLSWSGIGLGACALSVFGVLALLARDFKKALLFLFFPCAFILLMISQKANFTRNLLVFIPFCGVFCGAGAALISGLPRRSVFLRNLLLLILA
ncbi:MAG: phospholipid carrier-dependent glycosyltransferase, partial [Deltaproteobacteria bacterium]|nr:phospholipid carrier-dependent glycosyltransferase [Deltaproteobacteria bacterium]